ncbi:amino acid adenylation domain-containing protein [Streptomyces sp. NPDC005925]|uniref:non-ribosomal peptide synthetase/type I polyketide synthase n=1 Tax=Streptomyces sp. NPDC005925 TaxID=3157172 RepID=UPI0033DA9644
MATDHSPLRLADGLRDLRDVLDCAVVPLGATLPSAAFIVPAPGTDPARLRRRVAAVALDAGIPLIPVLVDDVPRRDDGTVDTAGLDAVPVLSEHHLAEYRRQCEAAGIRAEVTFAPVVRTPGRLHLAGLDPEPPVSPSPADTAPGRADAPADGPSRQTPAGPARPPALSAGPALVPDPDAPRDLPEALLRAAAGQPEAGLHLVTAADRTVFLSYPDLLARARRILGGLHAAGLRAGDRVLLQLPSLDAYFPALWGCLLGGVLPVTVACPPDHTAPGPGPDKVFHAWETLERPAVLAAGAAVDGVRAMAGRYSMAGVRVLDAALLEQSPAVMDLPPVDPAEPALLQLSSGSTGRSKAIRITHRGVLEYTAGTREQGCAPGDTTLNWLPLDHVAGLVMFHLRDTVLGSPAVHVPTELVVADPLLWLDLLDRYRAAHSWSPNFGYRMVTEALRRSPGRSWDLSAVRSLINAGEQCTLPVMSQFLAATAPYGLAPRALMSAWGMAETCTAICYQPFTAPGAVQHVRKASLTGDLEWVGEDTPGAERTTFLSMGRPAPGARFRICDESDRVLPEGRIGRLQVSSARVTPGYLGNPQANAEAFRGDGWFDTGDLAYLRDGALVITGRRKEVVVINGTHYFCHELEDVAGSLEGVTPGSVAACGVPEPGSGSERLVVFFVPRDDGDAPGPQTAAGAGLRMDGDLAATVRRVRSGITHRFGLPAWRVVPVTAAAFPRTTSGKIQRTALRARFLDGAFDDILHALDVTDGNARTVPDALHRAVWEPLATTAGQDGALPPLDPAATVVVSDTLGLADRLGGTGGPFAPSVVVRSGQRYEREGPGRYVLDPADRGHWDALWADLTAAGRTPAGLLYLAGYSAPVPDDLPDGRLRALFDAAGTGLVTAVRAHRAGGGAALRVVTVSRGVHRVTGQEPPAGSAGALTAAVAQCLALEWPGAGIRHVDLPGAGPEADADALCTAVLGRAGRPAPAGLSRGPADPVADGGGPGGVEVALRSGRAYRRRLVKVRPAAAGEDGPSSPLFTHGSCVVVTGGLGGVGREVLSGLLRRFRLRVLVLGRTPPEDGSGAARALRQLAALGDVRHGVADVADRAALAAAVEEAEHDWGRPLDAVLHLAGVFVPRLLADESPETWWSGLAAKTAGAVRLAELVRRRPGAHFVSFSSLLTVTPAAESASYIAGNRFLEAYRDQLASQGVSGHCVVWGLWNGTGVNRDNPYEELTRRRGLMALSPAEGRDLARVVLAQPPGNWFAGLDDTAPALRGLVRPARPAALERVVVDSVSAVDALPVLRDARGDTVPVVVRAADAAGAAPGDAGDTAAAGAAPAYVGDAGAAPGDAGGAANTRDTEASGPADAGRPLDAGAPPPADPPPFAQHGAPGAVTARAGRDRAGLRQLVLTALTDAAGTEVDERRPFHESGLGSLQLMRAHGAIERGLGRAVPRALLFRYPTAVELVDHLAREDAAGAVPHDRPAADASPAGNAGRSGDRRIAVIGMAGRFPGAADLDAYWHLIDSGRSALRTFTAEELAAAGVDEAERGRPDHVPVGGALEGADLFDAGFFGISAREAATIDPQQRLLLEICHRALEDGGYARPLPDSRVGVFATTGMNLHALQTYLLNNLAPSQDLTDPVTALQLAIGNQPDFAAGRVAHRLGLHGPAVGVQTACSSALVAVHLAVQSLLSGDADLALACAAAVHVPQRAGYRHVPGSVLSRTGACRAFDAAADGTVGGNGVAAVLLKRLDRALADGDTVHAVLLGTAVNNDGADKAGFTAPGVTGQRRAIAQALRTAGVGADSVQYVEAHGTGTEVGDPIEFQALTEAFRESTDRTAYCALGSAKPVIGHLDSAAGLAGLIKTVLALRHRRIPPLAGFTRPNPALPLNGSPFVLSAAGRPWERDGTSPRRAGVSALGVGGTNAHVVVEEAPEPVRRPVPAPGAAGPVLLPLSARTPRALADLAAAYRDRLSGADAPRPADVVATAALRRAHHEHRLAVVGGSSAELADALGDFLASHAGPPPDGGSAAATTGAAPAGRDARGPRRNRWVYGTVPREPVGPLVFLCAGQGTQRPGMAREPATRFPVFRAVLDECEQYYRDTWGGSLLAPLLDDRTGRGATWPTDLVQPALFAFETALIRLWDTLGVRPELIAGHSVGEYAAFTAAGALSLEDGLHLTAVRGRLMRRRCAPGSMAAVLADRSALDETLGELPGVEIAVTNGPGNHVIGGDPREVSEAVRRLEAAGHQVRILPGDRAFHCRLVEPMLEEFRGHVAGVRTMPLGIPVISGLDGTVLPAGHVPDTEYFVRQTRERADYAAVLDRCATHGAGTLLEIGPDATLTGIGRRVLPGAHHIAAQPRGAAGPAGLLHALGELYGRGLGPEWRGLALPDDPGGHIPLPTYPFQSTSYWIDAPAVASVPAPVPAASDGAPSMTTDDSAPATSTVRAETASTAGAVLAQVRELAADHLALPVEEVAPGVAFFDLGADSLLLINLIRRLETAFGVRIAMRELFEEADSPERLAALITERMDPDRAAGLRAAAATPVPAPSTTPDSSPSTTSSVPPVPLPAPSPAPALSTEPHSSPLPPPPPAPTAPPVPASPPVPGAGSVPAGTAGHSDLASVVHRQLDMMNGFSQLMQQQLTALGTVPAPTADDRGAPPSQGAAPAPRATSPAAPNVTPHSDPRPPADTRAPASHGPRVALARSSGMAAGALTAAQRAHLDDLTRRLTERTATSKAIAQRHRRVLADSRAVVGFRSATKEMLYPLAARTARGSRLEDVDGNRYVDITMGFGVLLFGHEPAFVNDAVRRYLSGGLRLGPRSEETGRAAELLAELTGFERVAFANSGTEANSAAIRLARAATGRSTVVAFQGSYHGHADNVLGRAVTADGRSHTVPVSSGIPAAAVADLVVLEYGADSALQALEELGGQVAAVLVEPVQSRHPGLQPKQFLHRLREVTRRHGSVLLFDEMLTGFRPHQRGAQGVFGVTPDLATYGKCIGGGYPIGAIAGRADIMDGIDGGFWSYGDDSVPPRDTTFFGGTYIQHPVAMAAAEAVLNRLKACGPGLQEALNATTAGLVDRLNRFFEEEEFPVRIARFGSLFRFEYRGNLELFFHHLLLRGVYVWEWRNFFLSTAHTEEDVALVEHAVRHALHDMRRGGFLVPPGGPRPVPAYEPAREVPAGPAPDHTPSAPPTPPPTPPTQPVPVVAPVSAPSAPGTTATTTTTGTTDFSLYFFGDYPRDDTGTDGTPVGAGGPDKYAIVLDAARFADRHGFHAVWLPERHFHSFGGVFPNPSVLGAALARETSRIRINAGCAVLPLHHPVRVAEEWSVVDNLSGGRVGIGCASGWHANDFVLQPEAYGRHKDLMYEHLETVRRLWRGDEVRSRNGHGDEIGVRLHPRPVQSMPPFYTAIVGNPESYRRAARHDLGVITNLMTQSVSDLAEHIALYRREREAAGLDPAAGRVVVLLHSYLGDDLERVRAEALPAFNRYMRSSLALFGQVSNSLGLQIDVARTPAEDLDFLLTKAYERYCADRALIGTVDSVVPVVDALRAAGADEIACFVDFGVTPEQAHAGLPYLDALRRRYQTPDGRSGTAHDTAGGTGPAQHAGPAAGVPLTLAQQRLWFLDRLHPGSTTYNECVAVRLDGLLDTTALRTALTWAVARHPALRSVFRDTADGPRQFVPDAPYDVPEPADVGGQDVEEVVRRVTAEENARPFDLASGPLLRTRLLRFGPDRHALVLAAHHIVFDSVSAEVLARDLSAGYAAAVEGRPNPLPQPGDGIRGYAERRRRAVDSEAGRRALAHWREQLAGAPEYLHLPADRPRPPVPSGRGGSVHAGLDAGLTKRVRELARSERATPFMVLLTAFYATVQRLTGQDDLVVGTPVADRPSGTEDLVGFFVNTLALRTDLGGAPTFTEALRRTRTTAFEAYEHQDLPFEVLVRELNPERDAGRSPIVQVCIEYETQEPLALTLPGVSATALDVPTQKAPFDLTLFLTDLHDGLRCRLEYSTDLFEEVTARRFLDYFAHVLGAGVENPDRPLPELPLTEQDRALLATAQTSAPHTGAHRGVEPGEPVHLRVLRAAASAPDALAVAQDGVRLTYGELAERSAVLAGRLRAADCGAGRVAAVLLPRGPMAAVALLAVLRAGAAYLPLDPAQPAERLAYMVRESGAAVLLTTGGDGADGDRGRDLPDLPGLTVPVLPLDGGDADGAEDGPAGGRPAGVVPFQDHRPGPDDTVCLLYTSGSTGRPKGVVLRHGGLANVVDWHHREFGTGPEDRASWMSSPGFDASALELWAHLAAGASVHPVPGAVRTAPEALRDWLVEQRVTSSFFTTPLAELLLALDWPAEAALRLLVTGGDRLRRWAPEGAPFRLVNVYGPTENTIVSTWTDVPERTGDTGAPPIGRPVPGTWALVLDGRGRPVPVGARGELYLGGAQVSAGYVARPEENRDRYVTAPEGCGAPSGGRLYRTGDLVRWRADGRLEFLGRADRQVKIRGHRVEPGEVEHTVLRRLPWVRQTAVVAHGADGERTGLTGYAVLADGVPDTGSEPAARERITGALARWLPDYLVPRIWVFADALPLNASGKVDHAALPRPDLNRGAGGVAPSAGTEQRLHELWAAELGLERIAADRSFFELGGHSLNATRLLNRIHADFGHEVTLLDFFRAPTIRGVAALLPREPDEATAPADGRVRGSL